MTIKLHICEDSSRDAGIPLPDKPRKTRSDAYGNRHQRGDMRLSKNWLDLVARHAERLRLLSWMAREFMALIGKKGSS